MKLLDEFKAFAMRGNVLDLAVAVVMGAAFGKIVASMVDGIIMPCIGLLLGGVNIADKSLRLGDAVIKWGAFLQSIIDFTLIAAAIFIVIKLVNSIQKQRVETAAQQPLSLTDSLLTEIRDELTQSRKSNPKA